MDFVPYLNFDGTCEEAFRFYEKVFGGRIAMKQTYGESPANAHTPAAWHDKLIHVRLEVNGRPLLGSDAPPPHFARAQGLSVTVLLKSAGEAKRVFTQLSEGGTVTMPFDNTFWSPGFGACTDRFGTPWMVNTEPE